jgi:hypothetical protein
MEASHNDESYSTLANSFLHAGLVPCWKCGYSLHTGTIDVTRKDFGRGQDVLIQTTTEGGLTALIRKEWENSIYLSYANGKFVEELEIDCFKTSGVQGRFCEGSQPDVAWQEKLLRETAEQSVPQL